MKHRLPTLFRDLFFLSLALATFTDQIFIAKSAQPILIFLGLFFLGAVPALQGDRKEGISPFARIVMTMMGVSLKDAEEAARNDREEKSSSPNTPTSSDLGDSASSQEP